MNEVKEKVMEWEYDS